MSFEQQWHDSYPFDEAVTTVVDRVADEQQGKPLHQVAAEYGVSIRRQQAQPLTESIRLLEYLDLEGPDYADNNHARVLFTPLDASVRSSTVMQQALHLFGTDQTQRLIVVGGPPSIGIANTIRFGDARKMWRGELHDTVDPVLSLLRAEGITSIDVMGREYGAELAAETARKVKVQKAGKDNSVEYVRAGVFVEPLAVGNRGRASIAKAHGAAEADESLMQRGGRIASRYRFSNYMVAKALGRGGFSDRLSSGLIQHGELIPTLVWSDDSDVSDAAYMGELTAELRDVYPQRRIGAVALEGVHRADFNRSSSLHTAVMLQGLRNALY